MLTDVWVEFDYRLEISRGTNGGHIEICLLYKKTV